MSKNSYQNRACVNNIIISSCTEYAYVYSNGILNDWHAQIIFLSLLSLTLDTKQATREGSISVLCAASMRRRNYEGDRSAMGQPIRSIVGASISAIVDVDAPNFFVWLRKSRSARKEGRNVEERRGYRSRGRMEGLVELFLFCGVIYYFLSYRLVGILLFFSFFYCVWNIGYCMKYSVIKFALIWKCGAIPEIVRNDENFKVDGVIVQSHRQIMINIHSSIS